MKNIALFISIATFIGCIGTIDSAYQVHGKAPNTVKCKINTIRANTGEIIDSQLVVGEFTNTVILSGPGSGKLNVVAECDGDIVKKFENIAPAKYWEKPLEIGNIPP